jgi:hypothetical protein
MEHGANLGPAFIGHQSDAFASMHALSRAAHSANDPRFVARGCGDHRFYTVSAQTVHDRGNAMVPAVTIAGFVAGNRIGRRDGSSPTSPIVAQYTAHYRDAANPGDPSVAQRTAQYCDVPNPTHPQRCSGAGCASRRPQPQAPQPCSSVDPRLSQPRSLRPSCSSLGSG